MAFFDSELSVFKITDTGAVERDISAYIVAITPSQGRVKRDGTTLGLTHDNPDLGIKQTSYQLELLYSEDALVSPEVVLGGLHDANTAATYKYYPRGVSGYYYTGSCKVENYQPTTRVGNLVGATALLACTSRTRTAP